MTAPRPAAESWQLVEAILDRPAPRKIAGQLAAFALDVVDDPASIASVPAAGAVQGALFDPEVIA